MRAAVKHPSAASGDTSEVASRCTVSGVRKRRAAARTTPLRHATEQLPAIDYFERLRVRQPVPLSGEASRALHEADHGER